MQTAPQVQTAQGQQVYRLYSQHDSVSDDDFSRRRRRDYLVALVRSVRPPQCGSRTAFDVWTRLGDLSITCSSGLMLAAVAHDSIVKRGSDLRRQVFSAVRKAAQLMRSRLPRAKQAASGKEMSQRRPLGFVARSRLEQDLDCTVRVRGQMHKNTEPSWRQRQQLEHLGSRSAPCWDPSHTGQLGINYEVTDVCGPVASVSSMSDAGYAVVFSPEGGLPTRRQRETVTALALFGDIARSGSTCPEPMNRWKQVQ